MDNKPSQNTVQNFNSERTISSKALTTTAANEILPSFNFKISNIPNLELYNEFMSYILKIELNIETIQTFLSI